MSVVELSEQGIIRYLVQKGMVSPSVPMYIEYFNKFSDYRRAGRTYRETIDLLSKEYGVSGTTVKKGIRTIRDSFN